MWLLHARLVILRRSYDSLDRVFEHKIGDLVAGYEVASKSTTVDRDDADLF